MGLYNKAVNALGDAYDFSIQKGIKDPYSKYAAPWVDRQVNKLQSTFKADPNTAPPTFSDYAWKGTDLAIWKLAPTGSVLGAGVGALSAVHSQTKLDNPHASITEGAMKGAVIGATAGAVLGLPGVFMYGKEGVRMARAANVGFDGNSIYNPTGLGASILNSPV